MLRDFAGCTTCPNQPKPTRNYDGVEFRFQKRFSNRWQLTSTYLYSRLYGNYSGLTSSDENNRNSPSVNRFFDGQYYSFDRQGQPVFGLLQTDRPHVFKIEGSYDLPWGTGVGLYWLAESGTPLQTQMSEKGIPFYPVRPRRSRPHADAHADRPAPAARLPAVRAAIASTSG